MIKWIRNWLLRDAKAKAKKKADEARKQAKELATANNEPWVQIIELGIDNKNPSQGYFELDWNRQMIDMLAENGYSGRTEQEIIDLWINDICRGVVSGDEI